MKMCLAASDTGEYQPVTVEMGASKMPVSMMSVSQRSKRSLGASVISGKKHVPGRAGGGWESSDDENEETNTLEQSMTEVSLSSPLKQRDLMIDSAW